MEVSVTAVAEKLLQDSFFLTALEFHAELMERGRELKLLRDFFANPTNFEVQSTYFDPGGGESRSSFSIHRSASQATLDSFDGMLRLNECGGGDAATNEKIALLEFELRKAQDVIKHLRCELESKADKVDSDNTSVSDDRAPEPWELRALNSLVDDYLSSHGHKLASLAFSETAEMGNAEDLGQCRAQTLVRLLRCKPESPLVPVDEPRAKTADSSVQTEDAFDVAVPDIVVVDERENVTIDSVVDFRMEEVEVRRRLTSSPIEPESTVTNELLPDKGHPVLELRNKGLSRAFQEELVKACVPEDLAAVVLDALVSTDDGDKKRESCVEDDQGNAASKNVVDLLAMCLPLIVPNVILAKRQELIPLLLCGIKYHSNHRTRDQLLHILFNLIKKPDSSQRNQIMQGFLELAKSSDAVRIEAEVLPQCWEQIHHKHPERRLLVAECCAVLAPLVPAGMRNSLMLSMVLQLVEDRDEVVRDVAFRSLAFIVALMVESSKYMQLYEVTLAGLMDSSARVKKVCHNVLLPVIAAWAGKIEKLHSHLAPAFMDQLRAAIGANNEPMMNERFREDADRLKACLPFIFVRSCLEMSLSCSNGGDEVDEESEASLPEWWIESDAGGLMDVRMIVGRDPTLVTSVQLFVKFVNEGRSLRDLGSNFKWICDYLVPAFVEISSSLSTQWIEAISAWIEVISTFCRLFGPDAVTRVVKPVFFKCICGEEGHVDVEIVKLRPSALLHSCLPVYLVGVLFAFSSEDSKAEAKKWLEKSLAACSARDGGSAEESSLMIAVVKRCFELLARRCPESREMLVNCIWSQVTHPNPCVRAATATVLPVIVPHVAADKAGDENGTKSGGLLGARILPAMVTLVNDHDPTVKKAVIPAFGVVLENSVNREVLDKVYMQFHNLKDHPLTGEEVEAGMDVVLIRTFGKSCVGVEAKFRDDVVLPWLIAQAVQNNNCTDAMKRREICFALADAFSSISCCFLRDSVVANGLLPGIKDSLLALLTDIHVSAIPSFARCLIADAEKCAPECLENLLELKREFEMKSTPVVTSSAAPSVASSSSPFASTWLSGAFAPRLANVSAALSPNRRSSNMFDDSTGRSPTPTSLGSTGMSASSSTSSLQSQQQPSGVLAKLHVPKAQALSSLFKKK